MLRWKRFAIRVLVVLLLAFIAIQFVPVTRDNPPVLSQVTCPDDVMRVLRNSCFDCHSNETKWPWYAYVAPTSWLVVDDVSEAREELNFSTWGQYEQSQQETRKESILKQVSEGHMPLWYYLMMHPGANVDKEDLAAIERWAKSSMNGSMANDVGAPQYTIIDVMEQAHEGDDALVKKVIAGKANREEKELLLQLYLALSRDDPPKGGAKSWGTKTAALVEAARAVVAGTPGAPTRLEEAVDCAACHKVHKPE